jgi:hypothetical protein
MFETILASVLAIARAIAPDLAMIVLGVGLARVAPLRWQALFDRITYRYFFPTMLFVYASGRAVTLEELASLGGVSWLVQLGALGLGLLARPWGPAKAVDYGGAWQTVWRFNTALGFVAAPILAPGALALIAVIVGAAVPMSNVLAVLVLARGKDVSYLRLLREVVTNPFLLASAGGVAFGSFGLHIPAPLDQGLGVVASVALPMTLVSVGLAIDPRAVLRLDRFAAAIHAIKLVASPVAVLGVGLALGAQSLSLSALLVFAALPTATASLVQAARYGADRTLVAGVVAQSTVLGCLTLPLWIAAAQMVAMK